MSVNSRENFAMKKFPRGKFSQRRGKNIWHLPKYYFPDENLSPYQSVSHPSREPDRKTAVSFLLGHAISDFIESVDLKIQ